MKALRAPQEAVQSGESESLATTAEVAAFLQIPSKTLYRWRYMGKGPPAYRVGRHLRFRWVDVNAWLDEQGRGPDLASGRPRKRSPLGGTIPG
jgi:excisionase family DNA binding protein